MIALCSTRNKHAEIVCHEVVHHVVETISGCCPDPIDEGTAVLVAYRVLAGTPGYEATVQRRQREFVASCEIVVRENRIPTLREMFDLGYVQFRESADHFELSRCLVEVLTKDEAGLARFRELLRRFKDSSSAWEVFSSLYSSDSIEGAWISRIREVAGTHDETPRR